MLTRTLPIRSPRVRRGLTLIEMLVTVVMLGLVGTALTRLLIQQGRNFSAQQARRGAQLVSRNSLGIMLSELRMAQDTNTVDSVGTNGSAVRLELPIAFGISCGNSGGVTVARFAPIDSLTQAEAIPAGYRWRNSTNGVWTTTAGSFTATTADVATTAVCTLAGIRADTIMGRVGRTLALTPAAMNGGTAVPVGTPIFLYQKVTYSFEPSTAYRQGRGLFRQVQGGTKQELLGPFDTTARFRYYVRNSDAATANAPASLAAIRGLEIVLNGRSETDAVSLSTGTLGPVVSRVTTGVLFKNTRQF